MAPRPKNPPPDRRQDILDAALELFARKGYAATTNAEIAARSGVTAAALYYYFSSKEELFKAAVSERHDTIMPAIQQATVTLASEPPHKVFAFVLERFIRFLTEEKTLAILRIVLAEGPRDSDLIQIWQKQVMSGAVEILIGYARQAMEAGLMRRIDPRVLFMMINGPVLATVITRDILKIPIMQGLSDDSLVQSIAETVINGLTPAQPERM